MLPYCNRQSKPKFAQRKSIQLQDTFFRLIIFPLAARVERRNFNVPGEEFFPVGCCFAVRSTLKNTAEVIFRAQVMNL